MRWTWMGFILHERYLSSICMKFGELFQFGFSLSWQQLKLRGEQQGLRFNAISTRTKSREPGKCGQRSTTNSRATKNPIVARWTLRCKESDVTQLVPASIAKKWSAFNRRNPKRKLENFVDIRRFYFCSHRGLDFECCCTICYSTSGRVPGPKYLVVWKLHREVAPPIQSGSPQYCIVGNGINGISGVIAVLEATEDGLRSTDAQKDSD